METSSDKNLQTESPQLKVTEADDRIQICRACDKYMQRARICGVCKCFMPAKVRLRFAKCPEGKW